MPRLFVDHLLHDVSDDRQFEDFVVVGFVHEEDPDRENREAENRKHDQSEEPDNRNMRQDHFDDPQRNPTRENTNIRSNRLSGVEFDKGALVDKQED